MKEQEIHRQKAQVQALHEECRRQQQQLQKLEVEKENYNKDAMDTKHRCIEQVRQYILEHSVLRQCVCVCVCTCV